MIIHLDNIHKIYHIGPIEVHALRGINFTINEGEFVSIMGPSGSGKSTLMHILGCLDKPSKGVFQLRKNQVQKMTDHQLSLTRNREIGFVFQSFNLLPNMTVLQNVELPMIYAGTSKANRRKKAEELLEKVGLGDRMKHLPNELSGGQRQRVAVARSLVNDPAIILADEPTGNLDSKTGTEIMTVFAGLHAEGKTILLVTHERDVAEYSQKIIHIRDGVVGEIEILKNTAPAVAT